MFYISKVYTYICRASNEASNQKHDKMNTQARNLKAGQTIKVKSIDTIDLNREESMRFFDIVNFGEGARFSVTTASPLKKSPTFKVLSVEVKNAGSYLSNYKRVNNKCVYVMVEGMNEAIVFRAGQKVLIID